MGFAIATIAPSAAPPAPSSTSFAFSIRFRSTHSIRRRSLDVAERIVLASSDTSRLLRRKRGGGQIARVSAVIATFAAATSSSASAPLAALALLLAVNLVLIFIVKWTLATKLDRLFVGVHFRDLVELRRCILVPKMLLICFAISRRDGRYLRGQSLRLLRTVHLFAFLDEKSDLASYARMGIDHDCDAESLLQRTQMSTLVIEEIKGDFRARSDNEIVGRPLEQHLLDRTQELQGNRGD